MSAIFSRQRCVKTIYHTYMAECGTFILLSSVTKEILLWFMKYLDTMGSRVHELCAKTTFFVVSDKPVYNEIIVLFSLFFL